MKVYLFSLLLKFKFLLIKNNDGFMIIRSKPCSLELLEQVKTFMICEKIDIAIADELKIAKNFKSNSHSRGD